MSKDLRTTLINAIGEPTGLAERATTFFSEPSIRDVNDTAKRVGTFLTLADSAEFEDVCLALMASTIDAVKQDPENYEENNFIRLLPFVEMFALGYQFAKAEV